MIVEESRIDEDDLPMATSTRHKERRGPSVGYGSRGGDAPDADRPARPELPELDDEPIPLDEEAPAGSAGVCKTKIAISDS